MASGSLLGRVAVGSWALWDSEIVRVDAIDVDASALQLGRGCADTVPVKHLAGARIIFCGDWGASDEREYVGGDVVSAKLLTRLPTDQLDPALATELSVTMNDRQARPYPPGQLRINGESAPASVVGAIVVTGVHRDRVQQADQLIDSEMASVGPEPGTTYTVRYFVDGALAFTDDGLATLSSTYTPAGAANVRVEVESVRDGLASLQMHVREFTVGQVLLAESGDPINTEDDQLIIMG
jgi:hypothetical protein